MNEALADPSVGFAIELATDILLKATVVLGIAGLASWWLRGASAALRNAVWSLALGSLLLLPLLSATLPGWKLDPLYVAVEPVVTASHPGGTLEGGAL
ncbi:MAG: hypothetical protein GWN99_14550, partial [Gemmatimonadetes bacterium]|nr:hypothetical protein [Gemmatimonadota bacterium]NIS02265.1 hypothetical protein [Gemmatimonadota bacterium]NIT68089.1 hypothetical protein [Gemmatimonadota bacterium]NIU54469.1 hypothetical protein [Gemmatimonadota bacterium]NIV23032.1 hypothetical protein [Gemmatimonadota bacterium]